MINIKYLSGFIALQLLSTSVFLIGYFSSVQKLTKQLPQKNPFFDRDGWFFPQFDRIIFITSENIDSQKYDDYAQSEPLKCLNYNIEFPVHLDGQELLNVLMRGINPLSILQYGMIANSYMDSIPHQIERANGQFLISSNQLYGNDYLEGIQNVQFKDFDKDFLNYTQENKFSFFYIDNLPPGVDLIKFQQQLKEGDTQAKRNTVVIILKTPSKPTLYQRGVMIGKLWFLSPLKWAGEQILNQIEPRGKIYPIESITSSLSVLLNIPIPLINNGIILPGLVFTKEGTPPADQIQLYDHIVNLEQLAVHLNMTDKSNPLYISQKQTRIDLANQFQDAQGAQMVELTKKARFECTRLNIQLNEEISGNILVLLLGILLGVFSLGLYMKKTTKKYSLYEQKIQGEPIELSILLITFLSISRENELKLMSVLSLIIYAFNIRKSQNKKRFNTFVQLTVVILYLNYPLSSISYLDPVISALFLWTVVLSLLGLWRVCNEKGQSKDRLCMIVGVFLVSIKFFPLTIFNQLGILASLVLGFLVLIGKVLGFLQGSRLLCFLCINYGLVSEFIPLTLLAMYTYLAFIKIEEPEAQILDKPLNALFCLIVYQTSLFQLPQSPEILYLKPCLVQAYALIWFITIKDFMAEVQSARQESISIKTSVAQRIMWNSMGWARLSRKICLKDQIFTIAISLLGSWFTIWLNELLKWDTTPFKLGNEYAYLQDSGAFIFILLVFLFISIWTQEETSILKNECELSTQVSIKHSQIREENEDDEIKL